MNGYVLIIDDQNSAEPVVELALEGSSLSLVRVPDGPAAKRKIVQSVPEMILCNAGLSGDAEFGFRFCRELSSHGSFSQIPVMLLCERIEGSMIDQASASGARGMIPWPIDARALRMRLAPALPQLKGAPPQPAPAKEEEKPEPKKERAAAPEAAVAEPALGGDAEAKFKLAQQLLAKVLHNLKTSNLLEVIEEDELPAVLLEITRKVAGEARPAEASAEKAAAKSPSIDDVLSKKR